MIIQIDDISPFWDLRSQESERDYKILKEFDFSTFFLQIYRGWAHGLKSILSIYLILVVQMQ